LKVTSRHIIAVVAVGSCLILPMFVIKHVTSQDVVLEGSATATVALGTIFRSNSRNVLKSTFMSAVRTGLRAMTRRLVRSFLPMLLRLFLPAFKTSASKDLKDLEKENPQPLLLAMGMGFVVLACSFYGVVSLHPNVDTDTFQRGFSLVTLAVLASSTLVVHYLVMVVSAMKNDVSVSLRTSLDGIILQAYFTGACSYLPLASDVELKGSNENKAKCSAMALIMMLAISLILDSIGFLISFPILEVWSAHILLYVFVISFPLRPLEGSDVFSHRKDWWGLIFMGILLSFLLNIPESFYAIL
jgi:hypothetical protein